jgi:hypothetical protein
MSRAFTKEEVRQEFLNHIKGLGKYWLRVQKQENYDTKRTIEGFLFSVYGLFDGINGSMPAFDIVVKPHPDDKQFKIDEEENYYEDGMCINDDCHLHELEGSCDF